MAVAERMDMCFMMLENISFFKLGVVLTIFNVLIGRFLFAPIYSNVNPNKSKHQMSNFVRLLQ